MSSDLLYYTSSDDEDEVNSELAMFTEACQAAYEALKLKIQRIPVERDRYGVHDRLVMAYFSEHPQYDEATFRERFRMTRRLFTKIVREVTDASYFINKEMIIRDNVMNNDVNVLRQSPIFNDLKSGIAPEVPFVANNVLYKRGYYLTDEKYPQWFVLIKSIKNPGTHDHKRILYKTKHEAARKDVERAFGVLKQKWKLIKYPA
uniref:Putative harbinger transposase-derived protein n=1 Tax=Tanacetum cinerariifolium TaxID=118510 RepID=A0A6L2N9U9_TANCI|nr:putative harbinger transposase-derived protein [Tanacetum cinerariifolium]